MFCRKKFHFDLHISFFSSGRNKKKRFFLKRNYNEISEIKLKYQLSSVSSTFRLEPTQTRSDTSPSRSLQSSFFDVHSSERSFFISFFHRFFIMDAAAEQLSEAQAPAEPQVAWEVSLPFLFFPPFFSIPSLFRRQRNVHLNNT